MSPTFNPPTYRYPYPKPLERWKGDRGKTVYRKNSVWYEVTDPLWSEISTADLVPLADRPGGERTDGTDRDRYLFLGGRVYTVSSAVGTVLTAAGYSVT